MVVDGDEVDEEGCSADEGGEEEGGEQHLADPHLAPHLGVQGAAEVAVDRGGGGVHEDCGGEKGATPENRNKMND